MTAKLVSPTLMICARNAYDCARYCGTQHPRRIRHVHTNHSTEDQEVSLHRSIPFRDLGTSWSRPRPRSCQLHERIMPLSHILLCWCDDIRFITRARSNGEEIPGISHVCPWNPAQSGCVPRTDFVNTRIIKKNITRAVSRSVCVCAECNQHARA